MNGRSKVTPAVSIVFVPDVAAKVITAVPAVTNIPVDALRFPYTVIELLLIVPANPVGFVPSVKSKSR